MKTIHWYRHAQEELAYSDGHGPVPGNRSEHASRTSRIKKYVDRNFPGYQVYTAYEAGCCGYSAHRAFESYGWHSIVFNPADLSRTGKMMYQKTDGLDAQLICRELKDGRLTGITVPGIEREQLRSLFRRRNDLVKQLRKIKTRLKANLLYFGIKVPAEYDNSNWSKAFVQWIRDLSFDHPTAEAALESRLNEYDFILAELRYISNELRAWCRRHYKKDYNLLRSVPGIGPIVACGILSELGDIRRFDNFNQLAGYIGLMPGMKQSGEGKVRSRGISPRGHRLMRSYFVEATWVALRRDPVMQNYYRTHREKDTKAILIKVARKLLSRTLAVMRSETPYQAGVVA
ncbi:MAG: IS110 family transposase [Owenweeksia sp.]|nr:IS110 family transposase [Owenweeksia sp.]